MVEQLEHAQSNDAADLYTQTYLRESSKSGYVLKYKVHGTDESVYQRDENELLANHQESRLALLRQTNASLLAELALDDTQAAEKEMKTHLRRLHDYNETKDVGQMLIGRLAVLRETTTRSLYPEFGLELDD